MHRAVNLRAFAAAHRDGARAETAGLAPASGPADGRAA